MTDKLSIALAALGLMGVQAGGAWAQPPAAPGTAAAKPAAPERQIVRWPGGWMYLDAPGAIYRNDGTATAPSTTISDSGNGVGNRITVETDGKPGVTVLKNVRNGVGNTLVVKPDGPVIELPNKPTVASAAPVHVGRGTKFWSKKFWSAAHDCNLYWDAKALKWYRYERASDCYLPVSGDFDPARAAP